MHLALKVSFKNLKKKDRASIEKKCASFRETILADSFMKIPFEQEPLKKAQLLARKLKGKFENLALVGIGGSKLGAHAIVNALLPPYYNIHAQRAPRLFLFEQLNGRQLAWFRKTVNPRKTLFCVISKSGETLETLEWLKELQKPFRPAELKRHFIIITRDSKNSLKDFAERHDIPHYGIPEDLSGRFSVFSHVGLIPCALMGVNVAKVLTGAAEVANAYRKGGSEIAAQLTAIQYFALKKAGLPITVIFPYGLELEKFADWCLQLYGESLGKNGSGITPLKSIGSEDQHSLFQLYAQGPADKFIVFINKKNPRNRFDKILAAQERAVEKTLAELDRPFAAIEYSELNEETLGGLLMLFQIHVALLGRMLGMNPFDQPGVEHLKRTFSRIYLQK